MRPSDTAAASSAARGPRPSDGSPACRVVLLALDGFPLAAISPERTPTLWSLRSGSGTGASGVPSTTYPGFASLVTGVRPVRHRVRVTGERPGAVPGWAGQQVVAVPTILALAASGGRRVRSVVGDHNLVRVLRLAEAGPSWPADDHAPAGVELDAHGYATNAGTREPLVDAAKDVEVDLLFAHLNEADTLGHDLGPLAAATLAVVAETDALVAELIAALEPTWDRTIVLISSDHDMEPRTANPAVRLIGPGPLDGLADGVAPDGGAALVRLAADRTVADVDAALADDPRIALVEDAGAGIAVVGCAAGWTIDGSNPHPGGEHGGPATARTVALVAGGHPAVAGIRRTFAAGPPALVDWAPTIAELFGVSGGAFDGVSLLRHPA